MALLSGKRILVSGIINRYSIAYGIARSLYKENAELAFSYQNDRFKIRVENIAKEFDSDIVLPCDVTKNEEINSLFLNLAKIWKKFDGFIHSIAYAPKDQLDGDYIEKIDRESFLTTHEISSYSFVAMAKSSKKILNENSSLVTLTYLGSKRAIPNYNIMGVAKASLEANTRYMAFFLGKSGIRVNAISAGPIKTTSSSGIKNFSNMKILSKNFSPIQQSVSIENIGNVTVFLCSDLSKGITGEIIHVDNGYHISALAM